MKFISAIRGLNHSSIYTVLRMFKSAISTEYSELCALGDITIDTPHLAQLQIASELREILTTGIERIDHGMAIDSPKVDQDIMKLVDHVYSYLINTNPTIADAAQQRADAARAQYLRLFSRQVVEMARQQRIGYVNYVTDQQ